MKKSLYLLIALIVTVGLITGCNPAKSSDSAEDLTSNFLGTKGQFVALADSEITLPANEINDGNAHFYNTTLPDGDPVYFFAVKSPDGNLRAAANGCQVCGGALQGFRQEGDFMKCNTCGNEYPLNKIATEKGGCNPAPINPDLKVVDGNVSISLAELQDIKQFFN